MMPPRPNKKNAPQGVAKTVHHIRMWFATAPMWKIAFLVGAGLALIKLPLIFTTLGEQDHGRLLLDAIAYADNGPDTLRKYGIYTSPLWTLWFGLLSSVVGAAPLVMISNIGGWLCGAAIAGMTVLVLARMGAAPVWAVVGGIAIAMVPGTFYMSLYGYPSQFALALLVGAVLCLVQSFAASGGRALGWLACSATLYALLATTKIDFAVAGTLLFAVAISMGRILDRRTAALVLFPVLAGAFAVLITGFAMHGESLWEFLNRVDGIYPWQSQAVFAAPGRTIFYSCGFGLVFAIVVSWLWGMLSKPTRGATLRDIVAWSLAALPMWLFWVARPPMSNRHAVPGVVATVLFAVLAASRLNPRPRAAIGWLIAVIVLNWPFGEPNFDFNYRPSGNLVQTLRVNRRAFAVANRIAGDVASRYDPAKILVGVPRKEVLGGIDLLPFVEVEMASRAASVHPIRTGWELVFTYSDGRRTLVVPAVPVSRAVKMTVPNARYYALYEDDVSELEARGVPLVRFMPNLLYAADEEPPRISD